MDETKKQMKEFLKNFEGMPDRLLKYSEILLEGEDASPLCYQDPMSFRRLTFELTTKCNIGCVWCYRHDPHYQHILNKDMPFELLEKIVENTQSKYRMIHIGGLGEPLLYPRIYDAIRLLKKLSDKIKITTNNLFLTPEVVDKLTEAGLTHIEISVLGFNEQENAKYQGRKESDKFGNLLKNIQYISDENKLHLQINTVITNVSYDSISKSVETLKDAKNLKAIHTIPLFVTEQCKEKGVERISDEKYIELLEKLQADIEKYDLDWELSPPAHGIKMDPVIEMKKKKNICFTCFEDPYIGVGGKIYPCGRRKDFICEDASLGVEKAFNGPKLNQFRKNMLEGNYPIACGKICYLKDKTK
jgi:MoaA/NifB/PqqE/SkfB family radical SAM enzyme